MSSFTLKDLEEIIKALDVHQKKPTIEDLINSTFTTPESRKKFNELCEKWVKENYENHHPRHHLKKKKPL